MKTCRCCGSIIKDEPILVYHNLPEKVQGFARIGEIPNDHAIDLEIYECPFCGLIQVLQEPVDYYRDVIRAIAVSDDMRDFRNEYFRDFTEQFGLKEKRILEVGCGCGEYIDIMKQFCNHVYGIEHKPSSVETAKAHGNEVYEAFIEDSETMVPGAPYDAFFIMNYLEHIPDLSGFLRGIYRNLADDGCGLVEVPNGDFVIRNKMFSEFMLEHLSYFTTETLRTALEINGFEVVSCDSIWHDYILSAKVRKRRHTDVSAFKEHKDAVIERLRKLIRDSAQGGHKTAVWGAGHQALTLLALADVGKEVCCVIDSAPFKQNRITPVSHIPIYAPEAITEMGIQTVIIMAGSYSDEVKKRLEKDYPTVRGIKYEED